MYKESWQLGTRNYFFTRRIVNEWNPLPVTAMSASANRLNEGWTNITVMW